MGVYILEKEKYLLPPCRQGGGGKRENVKDKRNKEERYSE
jgi:hypothetical protein